VPRCKKGTLIPALDGLQARCVGPWSKNKLYYVRHYLNLFSSSMRHTFPVRHYIDLFSGPGRCVVDDGSGELEGSPFIALGVPYPFTGHHFVDKSKAAIAALEARTRAAGWHNPVVRFYRGDANTEVHSILKNLPSSALSVAVIDPTGLHLTFDSLKALTSGRRMDLIYVFPEGIAARRNLRRFLKKSSDPLSVSLGTDAWKSKVRESLKAPDSWDAMRQWQEAGQAIIQTLVQQLRGIGYVHIQLGVELIGLTNRRNVEMYYLVFASKDPLGHKFWKAIRAIRPDGQMEFPGA